MTEEEFQAASGYIVAIGKHTNENHNEAVLMAGSLGLSALDLPAQQRRQRPDRNRRQSARSVLAHEFAADARTAARSCARRRRDRRCSSMPSYRDANGKPIEGAEVDVWQSSPEGFYENQDPVQADMNLRGKFITDAQGHISFRSVKPAGYPIPIDGPVGELLRAARPAQHAAGASAFPGLQRRVQDADFADLSRRTIRTSKPTCNSASPVI